MDKVLNIDDCLHIFDSLNSLIIVQDLNGKVLYCNTAACLSIDKKEDEVLDQFCYQLWHNRDTKCIGCPVEKAIISGRKEENVIVGINGRIWKITGIPHFSKDGKINKVIEVCQEITEEKNIEEELVKAKERAEESDKLKSAFLANISHEIRTPLNAILGFSNILKADKVSLQDRTNYLKIINDKGYHLLQIINDILDISKINAGHLKMNPSVFSVNEFIADLKSILNQKLKYHDKTSLKTVFFETKDEIPVELFTDRHKIQQVFSHVLDNAVKYTKEGQIEISCFLRNRFVLFSVKDTGVGIQPDQLLIIFDQFRQGDSSSTREYGGIGLGLSIAKKIIELLSGNIWLESEVGKGTTIYYTIPINQTDINLTQTNMQTTTNVPNWKNQLILIVEDEPSNYRYLEAVLKKTEANILYAADGEEAVEIFKNNSNIDIVLMDIQLPKMDGYTTTQKIKEIRKNIPVIAQTAHASDEDRIKSLKAGCDDYISKPIDKNELLAMISKFID
jgi:PAS domain S-box-containing protein